MCIVAHPDDESLGMGGTLARYASEGVHTSVIMATTGQKGRFGTAEVSPGPTVVGKTRARELREAAAILQVRELEFLGYMDGELDQADPEEIISKISACIRKIKPQVVITFGPEGGYGHPDHIAISQFSLSGIVKAADPFFKTESLPPFCVSKLYYIAWPPSKWEAYQRHFKQMATTVDGVKRIATPFPEWAVTTRIDTSAHWRTALDAILCHQTQIAIYGNLKNLSKEAYLEMWGEQEYYRVFSLVNGGRKVERDLFDGIE